MVVGGGSTGSRGGACVELQLALLPSVLVQCRLGSRGGHYILVLEKSAARSDMFANLAGVGGLKSAPVVTRAYPHTSFARVLASLAFERSLYSANKQQCLVSIRRGSSPQAGA